MPAADGGKRQIDDGVKGRRASFQRVSVNVNLERAADLAESLRGAVEFGIFKTVTANHGFDFPGGIVDGQKRALRPGLLFELNTHGIVPHFLNGELGEVTHFQEFGRFLAAGPGEIVGRENSAVRPDFDDRVSFAHREDESAQVASLLDRVAPIVVFVGFQLAEIVAEDVGKIASPTVAAFVAVQTVAERLVGNALHVYVQGSVDAQPALVDRFGAVRGFKVLTNLFEEVRRKVVARILNVQTERRLLGSSVFRRCDLPFFFHATEHEIAAVEREFGIRER